MIEDELGANGAPRDEGEDHVELIEVDEEERALDQRLAELEAELDEAQNATLRAVADFQNYRRRSLEEAAKAREFATAGLVERLLPLLDNFDRAIAAAEATSDLASLLEGVRLMQRQLHTALQTVNVHPIQALGAPFDPELHEAIVTENSDEPEGTILEVVETGYRMGSRVLRPSKARVSKGPAE